MGYYINVPEGKEVFLHKHGQKVDAPATNVVDGKVAVCLVDNGPFTAAAIAYSQEELEYFKKPDPRPKEWFLVPIELVMPFMDGFGIQ